MRVRPWRPLLLLLCVLLVPLAAGAGPRGKWRQVHPHWEDAYLFSFRSPDLLTEDPDEQWGRDDGRLVGGGIVSDFPLWLEEHAPSVRAALEAGRPVLLSLHVHSGYGTGLVTYSPDLQRAEVANYPWLMRLLLEEGLAEPGVTVVVDTCNAQATAANQVRPDLVPAGVAGWRPFAAWRRAHPARRKLPLGEAYALFARDRVARELGRPARGRRDRVRAVSFRPLVREERARFRARIYGPRGVILATPALFNLLRLGPEPRGTLTADLLRDRLDPRVVDALLARNQAEFRRFREFAFLASAGPGPWEPEEPEEAGGEPVARAPAPAGTGARERRIERGAVQP